MAPRARGARDWNSWCVRRAARPLEAVRETGIRGVYAGEHAAAVFIQWCERLEFVVCTQELGQAFQQVHGCERLEFVVCTQDWMVKDCNR